MTSEEGLVGLHTLHRGRAVGLQICLPSCFCPRTGARAACDSAFPCSGSECCLRCWSSRPCCHHSLVTPVYKRGDAQVTTANCRPISVTEPLSRLYAKLLNDRLVSFTETCNLRSPTSAGFRPGLSTTHQMIMLQHVADNARTRIPVYCCFIDLKSAYGVGPRDALWEVTSTDLAFMAKCLLQY